MDEHLIKPYGDKLNDGIVQLSFTLPVENSPKAVKAAQMYVSKLNFQNISVVHAKKIAQGFTYFVVYAQAIPALDLRLVKPKQIENKHLDFYEINKLIKNSLKRCLTVVGASIGTDAHTVGIDAIMNMKGYNQDYGLERYPEINAYNLGSQVTSEKLLKEAIDKKADAILVSQTVTQNNMHIHNLTELIELIEAENLKDQYILIVGGPQITNELAIEMGYDAGFGPDTLPSEVASYIMHKLQKNKDMT